MTIMRNVVMFLYVVLVVSAPIAVWTAANQGKSPVELAVVTFILTVGVAFAGYNIGHAQCNLDWHQRFADTLSEFHDH